jgi:isopenicillin N synthase-like dioxygenase
VDRVARSISEDKLPILDISRDPADVARALNTACEDVGFFYITNHGVAAELLRLVFMQSARFHAQPLAQKQRLAINAFHRGYIGASSYRLNEDLKPNLSESLVMMHELAPDDPELVAAKPLQGPNQWPELPEFRDTMLAYAAAMEELGRRLFVLFAKALDLPDDYFARSFDKPTTFLRLLHYPPQPEASSENQFGSAPHTDYGAITMLAQDDTGGLHVRHRSGDWIAATPIPGAFVVNVGDVMARWTNDRYVSTEHRVLNTGGGHRYSVPFFFDPNMDVTIDCLATCKSANAASKYPPVRYGDYLLSRLDAHYAYRRRLR